MFFECGYFARAIIARLRPDEDIVAGVEAIAHEAGFRHCVLRGALGSLNHAVLMAGEHEINVPHYGLEITTLHGEVRDGVAMLYGSLVDGAGTVYAGRFVRGKNRICVTAELTLEEWVTT